MVPNSQLTANLQFKGLHNVMSMFRLIFQFMISDISELLFISIVLFILLKLTAV